MLQKEVIERIVAKPKTKDYGRLSVLIQCLCDAKKLFNVSAGNFFPKPNVESAIIQIKPKNHNIDNIKYEKIKELCTLIFANKRKTIHKALKLFKDLNLLESQKIITTNTRAEELSVNDIIQLVK